MNTNDEHAARLERIEKELIESGWRRETIGAVVVYQKPVTKEKDTKNSQEKDKRKIWRRHS